MLASTMLYISCITVTCSNARQRMPLQSRTNGTHAPLAICSPPVIFSSSTVNIRPNDLSSEGGLRTFEGGYMERQMEEVSERLGGAFKLTADQLDSQPDVKR